jgi:hypothetical protein|tara:strand:- start:313 stop:1302 length:990 start_codon:yes stop_codon:yes gene_type:complete
MRIIVLFITSLIFISFGISEDEAITKVATSAANWLKIDNGVRGISMGGSQVASGRGLSGVYYNPSSIAFIESSEAFYSKSMYLAGITHNTLGYGTKLSPTDYFAVHLFYLDSGEMEVTTESSPDGTKEFFSVTNLSLRLAYGKQLTDRLRVGGALKYIREDIFTAYMQSFVFDLGSNFNTGIYDIILGMSVSNFGPEVQFHGSGLEIPVADTTARDGMLSKITKKFSVPLIFRLGIQKDLIGSEDDSVNRLTISMDGINPIDYTVYGGVGLEYSWRNIAFVRGGTRLYHDTAGLSLGGGLKWSMFEVDYAYVNYGILKETHQFGISLNF